MYPQKVEEVSLLIYDCYEEDLLSDYKDRTKDWLKSKTMPIINKFMLPKFLNGQDLLLTEDEVKKLFCLLISGISIESLKLKGLVDTIENEKGETIIFLTQEGKEISKTLKR